jgi:hypothetical protein
MLLIDVHKLQVILAQPIALAALEDQVQDIRSILSFDCQDIFALGGAQDLSEGCEVHAERNITIASVWGEGFGLEHHGDERDVRVVHGLEGDTGVIAVEVAVLDEILDCIDDLWESAKALKAMSMPLTFFSTSACSRRASNTVAKESARLANRIPLRGGGCAYS